MSPGERRGTLNGAVHSTPRPAGVEAAPPADAVVPESSREPTPAGAPPAAGGRPRTVGHEGTDGPAPPSPAQAPPPGDGDRPAVSRLVRAREEERIRIARELHDESIQELAALGLQLQLLRRHVSGDEAAGVLTQAERTVGEVTARLRHVLFDLRPPGLDVRGLVASLDDLAARDFRVHPVRWRSHDRLGIEPGEPERAVLYRIGREAIRHVAEHGGATWATLTLEGRDGGIALRLEDDGVMFESSARRRAGPGLAVMANEAEVVGGRLRIAGQPGSGVCVEVWIPVSAG
ncbi:MAG TPA: histidine kinase [Acidimicrobiales bacterium]|nr:histidine kinase [Acidimicrobiales bacterium]